MTDNTSIDTTSIQAAPIAARGVDVVERTVVGLGYEWVDTERTGAGLMRVTIDRLPDDPRGAFITVDDCERVTRQLQHVLEVEGLPYERLEVSSPGLDRVLKKEADYARFVGHEISVSLKLTFQGRRKYRGLLQSPPKVGGVQSGWRLVFKDDGGVEQALDFRLGEVKDARLVPVLDFKGRRFQTTSEELLSNEPFEDNAVEVVGMRQEGGTLPQGFSPGSTGAQEFSAGADTADVDGGEVQ
jgi:ribosome maturation factor RimP